MTADQAPETRLALPWLGAALREVGAVAGSDEFSQLRWLASRSGNRTADPADWREWLVSGIGAGPELLRRNPAGPCVMASATPELPAGGLGCLQPVHLRTAIDHLQMSAPAEWTLTGEESRSLIDSLSEYLAGTGFRLYFISPGLWILHADRMIECETVAPEAVVGVNIREAMPSGRDADSVNRLITELQMLLHEHPVNQHRRRQGRPTVNSVWPWGFGQRGRPSTVALPELYTDDRWLRGLWALHGGPGFDLSSVYDGQVNIHTTFMLAAAQPPQADPLAALRSVERSVFQPLKNALRSGKQGTTRILFGSREIEFTGRAQWRPWRRRPLHEVLG